LEGRAIYRELLDYCWLNGSLPADEKHLAKIADCTVARMRKHWAIFGKMFILNGDRYENERVNQMRPELVRWRESKKRNGALGGKKKAENLATAKAIAEATAVPIALPIALANSYPSSSSSSSSSIVSTPIFPALDPAAADFHQTPEYWSEKLREIHPKPSPRRLVEQFCVDHWLKCGDAAKYAAFMLTVSGSLTQWCEAWARNGNRFAPSLDKWLHDESYRKQPPAPESEFDNTDPFARRPQ
jgi:uncharacterized protein YdaU (DUF1376 family)